MNENKKGFHVTITDNETGEVLHDGDAHAVIGGIGEEDGAEAVSFTASSLLQLSVAVQAAEEAVEILYNRHGPALRAAVQAHKALTALHQSEETKNEEENKED